MIIEVIATTVILAQNWDRPCDRKLREWIASFTGRFVLTIPFTVYRYVNRNQADSTVIMQCVKRAFRIMCLPTMTK
jgi:hypothetical protein